MKTFKNQCAQGDMLITRINNLPSSIKKQEPEENGDHIVTHSETGHHHVVDSGAVNMFHAANDPQISFLEVVKPTPIRHLRQNDTHEDIQLDPGIYRINRQREYVDNMTRAVID